MIKRIRIYPKRSLEDGAFEASVNFLDKEGQLVDVDDERPYGPSLETVTITDGTEVTEFGTLNKWTVTAPVTLTLPEVVEGVGHLVHVDFLDRITWPAGTEVHGDTAGLTEAWLSLVGDDGHWTVLVSSSGDGLPEGMEYYPDTVALFLGDPNESVAIISVEGFQTVKTTEDTYTQVSLSPYGWETFHYPLVGGSPTGFSLNPGGFMALRADASIGLDFSAGESYTTLPEEGAAGAPHTLATREWVESQTPLPKSVAAVGNLAGYTSVEDGHSTLVVALGKPVWSLGSTFVDAIGTQVWPT